MVKNKEKLVPRTSNRRKNLKTSTTDIKQEKTASTKIPSEAANNNSVSTNLASTTPTNITGNKKKCTKPVDMAVFSQITKSINSGNQNQPVEPKKTNHPSFELIQSFKPNAVTFAKPNLNDIANKVIDTSPSAALSVSSLSSPQNTVQNPMLIPTSYMSMVNVSQNWASAQPENIFNHERTMMMLDHLVKTEVFHKIVFILSPTMIEFSSDTLSLCQYVCNNLGIPKRDQKQFWSNYSKHVEKKLNQKRADVSNAMKKTFKGNKNFAGFIPSAFQLTCSFLFSF